MLRPTGVPSSAHRGRARFGSTIRRVALRRVVLGALAAACVATLIPGGAAADAEQDSAHLKYRQKLMSAIGDHMAALGDIVKYQLELPGHVAGHAAQIAESSRLIAAAFQKRVIDGPTDAKLEIWQDWSGFEQAIADLEAAARELESVASDVSSNARGRAAGVGEAMKALGRSCGGCHKSFRKPKEESYKSQ